MKPVSEDKSLHGKIYYRTRSSLNLNNPRFSDGLRDSRSEAAQDGGRRGVAGRLPGRNAAALIAALLVAALVVWLTVLSADQAATGLGMQAAVTLSVFAVAVWFWIFSEIDDTYVALGAAVLLVVMGVLPEKILFDSLGDDTVWLLLGSFVVAAGITASGLATRAAAFIVSGAKSPRQLMHLSAAALVATAFAVPSTSGRAALAMPVFIALAAVLRERPRLVLALALLFPSVILLSAVGSYLGAGAHLITGQILVTGGYPAFSFTDWMFYGMPLAVAASVICVELVLYLFTDRNERGRPLMIAVSDLQNHTTIKIRGRFTPDQMKTCWMVAGVIVLWCSEPMHGIHPAIVGLAGGLLMTSAGLGVVDLGKALKSVPWSLLIFMAATLAMGSALVTSGAVAWVADGMLGSIRQGGTAAGILFVTVIVLVSTAAHLVIQSRSARSAVLIPIVVSLAPEVGVSAVAAAFASTAAAGFCHTISSSAKPMALYAKVDDAPTYSGRDLLKLSMWLAPVSVILVLVFAFYVWPLIGMPLFVK